MVEGARLESVYTVTPYRGFESLSLRHLLKKGLVSPFFNGSFESGFEPSIYKKSGSTRASQMRENGRRPARRASAQRE